jgi:hypothetical protein
MKKRIVFAMIMSTITTIVISFTIIAVNVGFVRNFAIIWLRSWCLSYLLAFTATLFLAPKVQLLVERLLKQKTKSI